MCRSSDAAEAVVLASPVVSPAGGLADLGGACAQTSDEFHLTVHVGTGVYVANLSVRVRPRHVHVAAAGHVLLSGSLWRAVRPRK